MRPASVGFQCPQCVKEGSRTTRSGRTAYGGLRPGNAALTSEVIIGINIVVWLVVVASGGFASSVWSSLALQPASVAVHGEWWRLLTSAFLHVQVWHIGFNMLALWVLGPQLELQIGRWRFVALYLLSALAGSAMVMWFAYPFSGTFGASGAIFGLMGALLIAAVKVKGDVRGVLTWIGANFVITLVFVRSISWQGHLGGFLGGLAVGAVLMLAPRERRTLWQGLGLGAITLVVVLASVVRAATLV